VNKGSTLLALLSWLEVETERVVTAGDSLNDLSMFATGLQSVMVGNAEPALLAALPRLPHTYRAAADGCEGIIEGLHHFGFGGLMASALP
jgi:hydroxymethylpyrimidine pyrophosphatase-like HAD family hydrolase